MGIPEILAGVLAPTALAIALVALRLWRALRASPWLRDPSPEQAAAVAAAMERLAVIVPAYNAAENVVGCLSSILDSTAAPLQVWLVDDDSTDATWELAQGLAAKRQDPRLHLLKGDPRPQGQTWVGKNWACAQAVAALAAQPDPPDYLLFLDCDVRLESGAIEAALGHLLASGSGLVSVGPQLVCGCLAEWLVQPIMMVILAAGYDFAAVNDPKRPKAFAFGPFMLFRRSAYEQVGGHAGVAEVVIEDVALGQRIKAAGLGLQICLGGAAGAQPHVRQWGRPLGRVDEKLVPGPGAQLGLGRVGNGHGLGPLQLALAGVDLGLGHRIPAGLGGQPGRDPGPRGHPPASVALGPPAPALLVADGGGRLGDGGYHLGLCHPHHQRAQLDLAGPSPEVKLAWIL